MEIQRSDYLTLAFALDEENLRRFCEKLEKSQDVALTFEIACVDKLNRSFQDLAELLTYENRPKQSIQKLSISGRNRERDIRILVSLEDDESRNIRINFSGPETSAIEINELVEDFLTSMRPWYTPFARIGTIGIAGLVLFILLGTGFWSYSKKVSFDALAGGILVGILTGGIALLSTLQLVLKRQTRSFEVFPMGTFSLGQGKFRHATKETIRTLIIFGLILEIVGGVITGFVFM